MTKILIDRAVVEQVLELLAKQRCDSKYEQDCSVCAAEEALRTALAEQAEPVAHDEDLLERLYWEFDHQRKKTGEERMAFKGKMRFYASDFRRVSEGGAAFAQSVTDDMMNLADRLGSEYDDVDPKAWKHLLVYAPQPKREPLTDEEIAELMMKHWGCASIAPRNAPAFARAIERAHGIGG